MENIFAVSKNWKRSFVFLNLSSFLLYKNSEIQYIELPSTYNYAKYMESKVDEAE